MKARVITSIALAPIVLITLSLNSPWPLALLVLAIVYLACSEIAGLLGDTKSYLGPSIVVLISAFALFSITIDKPATRTAFIVASVALLVVGVVTTRRRMQMPCGNVKRLTTLEYGWAVGPLFCLFSLHDPVQSATWNPKSPLFLILLSVWAGDIAGILVGKAIGKHKLAPSISPNKTIEGSIGNLVACFLVASGAAILIDRPVTFGLASGLVCGTLGQLGDLFESWVKRKAGKKDSGSILPGHGGIMDRIDSILFAAPGMALLFWLWPSS